jgi:signal transduction histidine kinase
MVPEKLARITRWNRSGVPEDPATLLREIAEECCAVFDAARVLITFEEADEPWTHIAYRHGTTFEWRQEPPNRYSPITLADARGSFFAGSMRTILFSDGEQTVRNTNPVSPQLRADFAIADTLSFPVEGETIRGRVFLLDIDDTQLAEIEPLVRFAASVVSSRIDRSTELREARQETRSEERVRVARDLHDGLLQSLTGIVLQIEAAHQLIGSNPDEAKRRLTDIEATLMTEQRELRSYLELLRPRTRPADVSFVLHDQLDAFARRFEAQWGAQLHISNGTIDPAVLHALGWETYRLITEAVSNAAKHGDARRIEVEIGSTGDRLQIRVADDGTGFPFRGRYNLAMLREAKIGPASLAERVGALNGELVVNSTDSGATLEIEVPLGFRSE